MTMAMLRLIIRKVVVLGILACLGLGLALAINTGTAYAGAGVVIEPGHGSGDPGATNYGVGLLEKNANLGIALKLNALLQQSHYPTIMCRSDDSIDCDEDWDMDMANAVGADLFISIHNNASVYSSASGTETWYVPLTPGHISFASSVHNNMVQAIRAYGYNIYDRGTKIPAPQDGWMIGRSQMPAILVECAFVSNTTEALLLLNPDFQQAVANGIFQGILDYLPPPSSVQFPVFNWDSVPTATGYEMELLSQPPEDPNGFPSIYRLGSGITTYTYWFGDTRDMAAGTYYWRAAAYNGGGYIGSPTIAQSFTVPKVSIVNPLNGQFLTTPHPVFQWSPISGASGYGIELLTQEPENPNGKDASQYRIGVGATSGTTWNGDIQGLSAGTYYYRVIAWNNYGMITGFSDTDSFTIAEVNITSPLNGQTLSTQFPVFQWDPVSGATGYGIELLDQPPENPNSTTASQYRIAIGATSGTTWNGDIRGLSAGTYYYRVIAWNQDGFITGFSDADSFVAPKVTLNSLSWTDATSPYFSWQAMSGATGYGIELLDQPPENPNSTTASQYRMAVGATSDTFWDGSTVSLLGGTYYYRVIAWNDNGFIGGFSDAASFEVIRPNLNTITWDSPLNPRFSWSAVAGATSYEIELLEPNTAPTNPNGTSQDPNRLSSGVTGETYWAGDTSSLVPGVYFYRVIAYDNSGVLGTYSNAGTFTATLPSMSVTGSGAYNICDQGGSVLATAQAGEITTVSSSGSLYSIVVSNGFNATIASPVRMVPHGGTILEINEMSPYNRYRGIIEIAYSSVSNKLWAVNELNMQDYLKGMGEEPESWPGMTTGQYGEFLKVSAVAFRSYTFDVLVKKNKHPGESFEICNDPGSCQWYIGYTRETHGSNLSSAVDQTYGQVLNYGGLCARTPYFSDCGGRTLSASEKGWNYPWCITKSEAGICDGHNPRGHGVGMCMDGARQRNRAGWNYDSVLHYYYTLDAGFGNVQNPTVRVGIFSVSI